MKILNFNSSDWVNLIFVCLYVFLYGNWEIYKQPTLLCSQVEELQRHVLGKEFLRLVEWEVNWMISKVLPIVLVATDIYQARHWACGDED